MQVIENIILTVILIINGAVLLGIIQEHIPSEKTNRFEQSLPRPKKKNDRWK